jgi:hypothetical protein
MWKLWNLLFHSFPQRDDCYEIKQKRTDERVRRVAYNNCPSTKSGQAQFANIITYLKHPVTNAISESINSRIQWVKYTARRLP